jgi:hypothetical protein
MLGTAAPGKKSFCIYCELFRKIDFLRKNQGALHTEDDGRMRISSVTYARKKNLACRRSHQTVWSVRKTVDTAQRERNTVLNFEHERPSSDRERESEVIRLHAFYAQLPFAQLFFS